MASDRTGVKGTQPVQGLSCNTRAPKFSNCVNSGGIPPVNRDFLRACLRALEYVKLTLLARQGNHGSFLSQRISREQFARILPSLESARRRTKPRTVDLYDVFCGCSTS